MERERWSIVIFLLNLFCISKSCRGELIKFVVVISFHDTLHKMSLTFINPDREGGSMKKEREGREKNEKK